jgi:hypothetical protein
METIELKEGEEYTFTGVGLFNTAFQKRVKDRKMVINKIFTRLGATQRSFDCTFLPTNNLQKPFHHKFIEYERLSSMVTLDDIEGSTKTPKE